MLQTIREITILTDQERINTYWLGWLALDPESGAFLYQTRGRGKGGLPSYILILPNRTPQERGGLTTRYEFDYPQGRKFIREWTEQEAIETANQKLAKMLHKQHIGND